MISWVLTARDDNYESEGVENYTMKRLNITLGSIYALGADSEVILVEFCPGPQDGSLKESVKHYPVKVITVKRGLLDLLQEESKPLNLPFYEYLAKDIGIKKATGDFVIACNPDNIFPSINFDETIRDMEKGYIVIGARNEIPKEYAELDTPSLITLAENGEFKVMARFATASGDFTGFKKELYAKIGGYPMVHGNWHMDNLFLDKARLSGYEVSMPYSYYHLNHSKDCKGAQGRPTNWQEFKPIGKKILGTIGEFIDV